MSKRVNRTHRRRAKMRLRNWMKGPDHLGVRDHSRPRPHGKKIRVKG